MYCYFIRIIASILDFKSRINVGYLGTSQISITIAINEYSMNFNFVIKPFNLCVAHFA